MTTEFSHLITDQCRKTGRESWFVWAKGWKGCCGIILSWQLFHSGKNVSWFHINFECVLGNKNCLDRNYFTDNLAEQLSDVIDHKAKKKVKLKISSDLFSIISFRVSYKMSFVFFCCREQRSMFKYHKENLTNIVLIKWRACYTGGKFFLSTAMTSKYILRPLGTFTCLFSFTCKYSERFFARWKSFPFIQFVNRCYWVSVPNCLITTPFKDEHRHRELCFRFSWRQIDDLKSKARGFTDEKAGTYLSNHKDLFVSAVVEHMFI